jgi:type II secretory pathway component PulJ
MKIKNIQPREPDCCGFTLVEMSAAMAVMMVVSTALVAMMQQHIAFLQRCQQQVFLTSEAPKIGNLLNRILNSADHYFVYATKEDALGSGLPILTSGSAVKLFFKSAAQTTETRILSVEPNSSGASLRFYTPQSTSPETSWTVSSKLRSASFLSEDGILSLSLLGPNYEQVTYYGGAR